MNLVRKCFHRMTVYEINERETKEIAKSCTKNEEGFWHNLRKYLREYAEVTGLHGFRYVAEKRSTPEKIVWGLLLMISLGGCVYMINDVVYKYENSPVVVSFATEDTPLYQIPFPAVTICPEGKYSKQAFNYSDLYYRIDDGKEVDKTNLTMFHHLSLVCEDHFNIFENETLDNQFFKTISETKIDPTDMFATCFYNDEFYCEKLFTPVIIDEGLCYSFNIFGREDIFKDHVYNYDQYYHVPHKIADYFDMETGYKENAGVVAYPRRALMSGVDNGFTVFFSFDEGLDDPLCTGPLHGFRVLIHSPWDVPLLRKHYFRMPSNKVVAAAMEAEIVHTSKDLRKFGPNKRKCYMHDERPLKHFKMYTQSNCLLECRTNHTLKKCGCVEYFMPRDNATAICGYPLHKCDIESTLFSRHTEYNKDVSNICDCKPDCSNLKFTIETSQDNYYEKEFLKSLKYADTESNRVVLGMRLMVLAGARSKLSRTNFSRELTNVGG
ncbi:pickpocket protein 28-like [Zophobas morio]|uniref:pickpocket protein 28-like n=1 Tax=Zophobas morio TaxID=2755281 RepID=UPI0030829637